jgi:hypothetical protein
MSKFLNVGRPSAANWSRSRLRQQAAVSFLNLFIYSRNTNGGEGSV